VFFSQPCGLTSTFIYQDIGNLESDPEEFARTLCDDLNITDPEVGVKMFNSLRALLIIFFLKLRMMLFFVNQSLFTHFLCS
jgi:hypothetical protein